MANSLVRLFTFQNAMDLGLQPEMGLDHAGFQITWWSLFSLACIPGIEKVVGWIWTAMDSEPRRWSFLWAQGTATYMSCKHCNYCTFSNNSPLPWLFRAVTELNLARMTTVTAIEGHLKTEAWSLKWSLKPHARSVNSNSHAHYAGGFFRGLSFPGLPSKEAHPYHRKH